MQVHALISRLGPFQRGYARILVEHMNSKTMLHKITGVLLEVNIERNETWPDEQDEALAQTVMDLNAEEFTSRQQEIVEEIMAIHGVTRVTVLFTG